MTKKMVFFKMLGALEEGFYYHEVYELAGEIYDPRYSDMPIDKVKYMEEIMRNNPNGVKVESKKY